MTDATPLTDAEVAAIEKRHADCEGFYANHGGYRPDWHKDRTILLAKLRTTSQAEAQAPTTAALTEEEADAIRWMEKAHNHFADDDNVRRCWLITKLVHRLTVGAPAPATAPKHALRCGYWLDLNCSCKLEGDTP